MTHHNTTPTVRFSDMVQNINERILPEDPEGLPYVGLEQLDPESLKIRRWGTPSVLPQITSVCFHLGLYQLFACSKPAILKMANVQYDILLNK
jgi:hypothetical protein